MRRYIFLVLLNISCAGGSPDARPLAVTAQGLSVWARRNPTMVVAADLSVDLPPGVTALKVSLRGADELAWREVLEPVPPGQTPHDFTVHGLRPGQRNELRVQAMAGRAPVGEVAVVQVTTGPLPEDFPAFTPVKPYLPPADRPVAVASPLAMEAGSRVDDGQVALSCGMMPSGASWGVVLDRHGRVLWYRQSVPVGSDGLDFQQQPSGRFTLYQDKYTGFEELSADGRVVGTWVSPSATHGTNGHELFFSHEGERLISGYIDAAAGEVHTVDILGRDGEAVFHFATDPDPTHSATFDPNAAVFTPDHQVLLSMRNVSSVWLVDRATAKVRWRLGGDRSDFTFVDDPLGGFSFQHYARMLPDGQVLMFDNGNERENPYSRAVQYRLDPKAGTATMTWQYAHPSKLYSVGGGSAHRKADGNTVIAWAMQSLISEVDPGGELLWEMKTSCTAIYRVIPLEYGHL